MKEHDPATESSAAKGRIKGAAIREFIAWHAREHGPEPLAAAVRRLPAEQRAEFDLTKPALGILSSAWIPANVVHAVLDDLTRGSSVSARDELARNAADATIVGMMSGVQKIVFATLMTPAAYSRVANLIFRLNYESGRVICDELGAHRHRGHVEGWVSHHPFLCQLNVEVKARVYRVMQCEDVRIESRFCRSNGDAQCGSIIVWR